MKVTSALVLGAIVSLAMAPRAAAAQSGREDGRRSANYVCAFRDINYQGPEQCFDTGDEIASLGLTNKSISSFRVYGRATISVYEDTGFRGHAAQFDADAPDLGRRMMVGSTPWSDHIQSIKIGVAAANRGDISRQQDSRDGICVYDRPNYEGRSVCWAQGEDATDLARQGNWSDTISSVRVFGRTVAVLYQDIGFRGERLAVDNDIPDLAVFRGSGRSPGNWSKQISSVQVSPLAGNDRGNDRGNGRGSGGNRR